MRPLTSLLSRAGVKGRWWLPVVATAMLVLAVRQAQAQEMNWATDLSAAKVAAAELKHFILLDFTGSDWCPWCVRMDQEVFSKPAFADFAAKNLVLVKLDFPRSKPQPASEKAQNEQLAQQFKIEGYPTYVLLDSSGKEMRRQVGCLPGGPAAFIQWTGLKSRPANRLQ